jgi:hypothetical protein
LVVPARLKMTCLRDLNQLVFEPARFFAERQRARQTWHRGAIAPLLCAGLYLAAQSTLARSLEPLFLAIAVDHEVPAALLLSTSYGMALASALGLPAFWALATLSLICLDVLFVDSRRLGRLFEVTGSAFYSQLPALGLLVWAALTFDDTAVRTMGPVAGDRIGDVRDAFASSPRLSAAVTVNHLCHLWLCGLLATSYRCVSGLSAAGTWAIAAALYAVFFLWGAWAWFEPLLATAAAAARG